MEQKSIKMGIWDLDHETDAKILNFDESSRELEMVVKTLRNRSPNSNFYDDHKTMKNKMGVANKPRPILIRV